MPVSRLRLRLAALFAVAVLVAVAASDLGLTVYLRRQAEQRATARLRDTAVGMLAAVRNELTEPGITLEGAVHDALAEWPAGPEAFAVFGADGGRLGTRGDSALVGLARPDPARARGAVWDVPFDAEGNARLSLARDDRTPALTVIAARTTADLREDAERLTQWLLFSVPGVSLFALLAGYLLARRVLRPVDRMRDEIAGIAPEHLDRRLPVREPQDELDRLADQFNRMLARLAEARERNRVFLARVAHQLKTPLTVVRGESALGLERERTAEAYRETLMRVRLAAEQMSHRVDDLVLLAQAEAGEQPPLTDEIELDGLALECTDLMRGRAQQTRHALELGQVSADAARGNAPLMREALMELLENAVRYGEPETAIRVSAHTEGGTAVIAVESTGPVLAEPAAAMARPDGGGLGLSIVRWIAAMHGGDLSCRRAGGRNIFEVRWPARH